MGTKNLNSATNLITFTRASGGTALRKISYGSELITNGTFDTDISGWNNDGTTSAIVGNQIEVTSVSGVSGSGVNQTITTVAGKRYKFSSDHAPQTGRARIEVKDNNNFGSGLETLSQTSATGTYEFVFVALSNSTYIRLEAFDTSSVVLFDNISVKEVLYDQPDGTLQLWNHGNNEPRIEYDATATGAVKGLLIEEARTNVAKYSEDFTNPYWKAYAAVTTTGNVAIAPDGNLTADRIAAKNAATNNGAFTNDDVPTGGCVSVFAKADTVDWLGFGEAGDCWAYFDLANGVTGNKSTTIGHTSITAYPNGWYLCQAWGITNSWSRVLFSPKPTEGNGDPWSNVTNAIGDSVFLWGAQMEAGAFPSSYIPTTGSTATRAADVTTLPTSAFGYNQKAGTVLVEFKSNKPNNEQYGAFGLSDGSATNRIAYYATSVNTLVVTTAGVGQAQLSAGLRVTTSELVKFSAGYAENDFAASLNGATTVTDTAGTVPSGISSLGIGHYYAPNPSSNLINGHIKFIKYYPRRLTNTQLQELTT